MILFYSQNSPYSRIARIALRESGLISIASERLAANRQPDNPVLEYSPVGRVPTLVDDGLVITEAKYVFDYIGKKSGFTHMQIAIRPSWPEISQEGQILGFVDGIACWVRENRRELIRRSEFLLNVEKDRSRRCLAHLDNEACRNLLPDFPAFRSVALAVGIGLMDLHDFQSGWRTTYPNLSTWFDIHERRGSMVETAPEP
jgi:glutathione S-transferase